MKFENGKMYMTIDWFTGGTIKMQYEGDNLFTVEDFELDGLHHRTEKHEIKSDKKGEYIVLNSHENHEHRLYARGN